MGIEIINFKPFKKNTLRGFLDVKLTNMGLTIKGCTYHQKNGKSWIGLPARPYEDDSGNTTWTNILFFDEDYHVRFQSAALKALEEYLQSEREETQSDDIPF